MLIDNFCVRLCTIGTFIFRTFLVLNFFIIKFFTHCEIICLICVSFKTILGVPLFSKMLIKN